jgi:dTDP-4-amino-4,6-dideoxygalactose transaminase
MGLCNLKNIDQNIEKRKKIYEIYRDNLEGNDLKFQKIVASKYNYSYMPVCFKNLKVRNEIYNQLLKERIHCRKYFYPLTTNFGYFNKKVDLVKKYNLKKASDIADRVLCLPLYPDLSEEIVIEIINKISSLINEHSTI